MRRSWMALAAGAAVGALGAAAVLVTRLRRRRVGPADDGLADLTRGELYERAKAADIPGRSAMSKDELIRALRNARAS